MKKYTSREDIANAVTHLFGLIFGIPATVILLKNAISTIVFATCCVSEDFN